MLNLKEKVWLPEKILQTCVKLDVLLMAMCETAVTQIFPILGTNIITIITL